MLEILLSWGIAATTVFYPILEDLVEESAKDWAKDFFKGSLSHVFEALGKETKEKAAAKALNQFFEMIQQELRDSGLSRTQIKEQYLSPFKKFINQKRVKDILSSAFERDCRGLDVHGLAETWELINSSSPLPKSFNWERVAKSYLNRVQDIIEDSEDLRKIYEFQNLERIADNTQTEIKPGFDLTAYQEGILERYGNLSLENLEADGAAYNALKLWKVFVPQDARECQEYLPKVYEIPKEYLRQLRESGQLEREVTAEELAGYKRSYLEQSIRSVLEIIYDYNYLLLVILGDPGSGKSSLLKYLALDWANLPVRDLSARPIPLLIELREYVRSQEEGECKTFLEFIHKGNNWVGKLNQHELHERLLKGQGIVMFDGLDEVFELAKRETIKNAIHDFSNTYPQVKIIVTSRVIGYEAATLKNANFRHFMLQDLEADKINDFIAKWHELTYNQDRREFYKNRLKKSIEQSPSIQELAGNPLLLTMMAILNRHQELPRDRAELYNQCTKVLLYQLDFTKKLTDARLEPKYRVLDYGDKQTILRDVAYFMQTQPQEELAGNLISERDLREKVTESLAKITGERANLIGRLIIEQLRERNFILCLLGNIKGEPHYAFVHRTFLEYFCAAEFVRRFEKTPDLPLEALIKETFGKHWRDEKWHEILRLIAGMIGAKYVGDILEFLRQQGGEADKFINLFLAADCLAEVKNPSEITAIANQLLSQIKSLIHYDLNYYYEDYGEEAELVREIRTKAVKAVAVGWKDNPETFPLLKSKVESDENWIVRQAAVEEIVRGWKDNPETFPLLKSWVESDENWDVRQAAVREIARGWKDNPETFPLLKSKVESDENGNVRRVAVQEIARGWKDNPDAVAFLAHLE
jgi:predicted NACHT family NTPase